MPWSTGTGVFQDTYRAGFIWEVHPDLTEYTTQIPKKQTNCSCSMCEKCTSIGIRRKARGDKVFSGDVLYSIEYFTYDPSAQEADVCPITYTRVHAQRLPSFSLTQRSH